MYLKLTSRIVWCAGILLVLASCLTAASIPNRISEHVDDGLTFRLAHSVHPKVQTATDLGLVPESFDLPRVTIHLQRSTKQQQELDELVKEQQDPTSSNYHKWLTPEEFASRFGVSKSDIAKVKSWAESKGFSNVQVARTGTFLTMSGTAAHAQAAFGTSIHSFQTPNGEMHYANANDPVVPNAFNGVVRAISGLNNFRPRPHIRARSSNGDKPRLSSYSGYNYVTPPDFATIYDVTALYNAGVNGTGVKIAIPGQTDLNMTQVQTFRSAVGLTANTPQTVLVGTDPGVSADDQFESYLDVEWSGGVAPNATIIYVYSQDVFSSVQYIIDQNLAQVLPITYGDCEAQFGSSSDIATVNDEFETANAEGITVMAAAGDTGAADCDDGSGPSSTPPSVASQGLAVDFPGSSPYVTDIGGTAFNENGGNYWATYTPPTTCPTTGTCYLLPSALSYIPEMVWNDTSTEGQLAASGGGASSIYTKPSWQTGTGVPSDGMRDVPDLAFPASVTHDEVVICASDGTVHYQGTLQAADCVNGLRDGSGDFDVAGGTSVGSPSFAGLVALLVQQYGAQGNINPRIYALAGSSSDVYHDVTVGNNEVPCQTGTPDCPSSGELGYSATTGYDLTTGWGSVDADHMASEWAPNFSLSLNPITITVGGGTSGTSTLTITGVNGFSGTVSLSCSVSSALTNTTCSVPSTVSGAGTATVTVTNSNSSFAAPLWRKLPPGGIVCLLLSIFAGLSFAWQQGRLRALPATCAVGAMLVLAGCGGGSSSSSSTSNTSTVNVSGSVVVTATSGSISKTVTLTVTDD